MMLSKTVDTAHLLAQFLRGAEIARGSAGSGSSAGTTFTDLTADAFASVSVGQTVYIDGEGTFTIATVTDDNNIELSAALSQDLVDAHWRVCKNAIAKEDTIYVGPDSSENSKWNVIWDSTHFKNVG